MGRYSKAGVCPEPTHFALALEPSAATIRYTANYSCMQMMFCCLPQTPKTAVPHILSLIDSFSLISGYRVNWGKSEAMPWSRMCPLNIRRNWQFKSLPSCLVYLGIKLTPGLKDNRTK